MLGHYGRETLRDNPRSASWPGGDFDKVKFLAAKKQADASENIPVFSFLPQISEPLMVPKL